MRESRRSFWNARHVSASGFNLRPSDGLRRYLFHHHIAITTALTDDKLTPRQCRLKSLAPLHLAPQVWFQAQRHVTLKFGAKPRNPSLRSLPSPRGLRTVPNATSEAASPANQNPVKRPEHLRTPPTCRANEQRPTTPIGEFAQRDSDHLLDVAEPHDERRRLDGDDIKRPQARGESAGRSSTNWRSLRTNGWVPSAGVLRKLTRLFASVGAGPSAAAEKPKSEKTSEPLTHYVQNEIVFVNNLNMCVLATFCRHGNGLAAMVGTLLVSAISAISGFPIYATEPSFSANGAKITL